MNAGELKQGVALLRDASIALAAGLKNIPDDEAVAADTLQIAIAIDPALAPIAVLLPVAEFIVEWILANNTQGQPDSQTPMFGSGDRGGARQAEQKS